MKFQTRIIKLIGESQRELAISMVNNMPLGLEVVAREPVKKRSLDSNALYWAALNDIAEQVYVNNKQFTADIWHIHAKTMFLYDEIKEPYLPTLVINPESYRKYSYTPIGDRVLIASTAQLTKLGMSNYLEQVFAMGAGLGVMFSTRGR